MGKAGVKTVARAFKKGQTPVRETDGSGWLGSVMTEVTEVAVMTPPRGEVHEGFLEEAAKSWVSDDEENLSRRGRGGRVCKDTGVKMSGWQLRHSPVALDKSFSLSELRLHRPHRS